MTKICICGGGNLGHVCAGFLSAQPDVEVNLLTTHPDSWSSTIEIDDPDGKTYHGHLSCISSNPAEALLGVDIVLLCLPGYAIHPTLQKIAPHISDNVWVGSVVSSTGFFFEAMKILPKNPLFGFQRVPFISRVTEYGCRAALKGYKKTLSVAVEQTDDKQHICDILQELFDVPIVLMDSYYEVCLSNSNPLLHPARLYTMWKDWHPGVVYEKNPFFYYVPIGNKVTYAEFTSFDDVYYDYCELMCETAREIGVDVKNLEAWVFGWPANINVKQPNPRVIAKTEVDRMAATGILKYKFGIEDLDDAIGASRIFYDNKIDVPTRAIDVISVTKDNMMDTVIADGFQPFEEVYKNVPEDERPAA